MKAAWLMLRLRNAPVPDNWGPAGMFRAKPALLHTRVMVNGPAWKALIKEEFGDGIMSAIDFDMTIERLRTRRATASRSACRASPAVQLLRRHRQPAGGRV